MIRCPSVKQDFASLDDALEAVKVAEAETGLGGEVVIEVTASLLLNSTCIIKGFPQRDVCIRIKGVGRGNGKRIFINSAGHSVFKVLNRARVVLEDVNIVHTCYNKDKKQVGAGVFCMNKCQVILKNCEVVSKHGFALWAVQRAHVIAENCQLFQSEQRSGIVAFGSSRIEMDACVVRDCKQHGLCVRGRGHARIQSCRFVRNGVRAIYVYHHATLIVSQCIISHTQDVHAASVEAYAAEADVDSCIEARKGRCSVTLLDTEFFHNQGSDLKIHDAVYFRSNCHAYHSRLTGSTVSRTNGSVRENQDRRRLIPSNYVWFYNVGPQPSAHVAVQLSNAQLNHSEGWKPFDPVISSEMEKRYLSYLGHKQAATSGNSIGSVDGNVNGDHKHENTELRTFSFTLRGNRRYEIDFETMEQTNCDTFMNRTVYRLAEEVTN